MQKLIFLVSIVILLSSCNYQGSDPVKVSQDSHSGQQGMATSPPMNAKSAVVLEAHHAGTYSYLKLENDGMEFWAAITSRPVEIGKRYYYTESVVMKDFTSKQLDRTFESILFIDSFTEQPAMNADMGQATTARDHTSANKAQNISIEHASDEIPIADLFRDKDKYQGKQVKVKGIVIKINENIMNMNWIHLQDGTAYEGQFDLTITTSQDIDFKLGEVVSFTGNITLDKDFGAGYKYGLIMENASFVK